MKLDQLMILALLTLSPITFANQDLAFDQIQGINPLQFEIELDPKRHVVEYQGGGRVVQGEFATHSIVQGVRYIVTLKSTVQYRAGLPVKQVVISNGSDEDPEGFFHVVSESKPITITAGRPNVYAFFIDSYVPDNTGRAILTFTPVF